MNEENSGLAEALKFVVELQKQAMKPSVFSIPGEPRHIQHVANRDGTYGLVMIEPEPLNVTLGDPGAFLKYVENHAITNSVVFYNQGAMVHILDYETRRDRATCNLVMSPQFQLLLNQATSAPRTQYEFLRMLRIDLRGCLPTDSALMHVIRHLKWRKDDQAEGTIAHGIESLGKSVTATVTGDRAMPDEVSLMVQVWQNVDFQTNVHCAVEVIPAEQKFRLTPFPGAVQRAIQAGLIYIGSLLGSNEMLPISHQGHA